MILFGSRTSRDEGRTPPLRRGALLAILAMFSQTLISLLPMQAMAATSSSLDPASICQPGSDSHPEAPKPAKSSGHAAAYCPVCQAVQLLGSLVSPSQPALLRTRPAGVTVRPAPASDARPDRPYGTHQARAPPPSV